MSKPPRHPEFRSPRWLRTPLALASVLLALACGYFYHSEGLSLHFAVAGGLLLLVVLGLADAIQTRVTLRDDQLQIRSGFRTRTLTRAELGSVSWATGCSVTLRLRSGAIVALPDVGNSQAVANSIRAWIKRTQRH